MLKRDECNFYQLARNFLPTCAQLVAHNFWHLRVTYEKLRASLDMIKKELKDFLRATFEKLRASLLARNLFHLWPKRPLIQFYRVTFLSRYNYLVRYPGQQCKYDTTINIIKPTGDHSNKVQQSDWSKL